MIGHELGAHACQGKTFPRFLSAFILFFFLLNKRIYKMQGAWVPPKKQTRAQLLHLSPLEQHALGPAK